MTQSRIDDTLLVAFADGELDPATMQYVEAAMAASPDVRARIAMFRHSGELLKSALSEGEFANAPSERLSKGLERAFAATKRRRVQRWALPIAAAICGLMIGDADWRFFAQPAAPPALVSVAHVLSEVAEYHSVFARESEHLVEVPAWRKEHIETWLGNRTGLAFNVPDLATRDLKFEGARMLVVDGRPVAQLMYTGRAGERVAVCFTKDDGQDPSSAMQKLEEDGQQLFGKAQEGFIYVAVGPSDYRGIEAIASELPSLLKKS